MSTLPTPKIKWIRQLSIVEACSLTFLATDPAPEIEQKREIIEQKIATVLQSFSGRTFDSFCLRPFAYNVPGHIEKQEWGVLINDAGQEFDAEELFRLLHSFDCPVGVIAICDGTFDLDRLRGLDLRWLSIQMGKNGERIGSEDSISKSHLRHFAWHSTHNSWTNFESLAEIRTLEQVSLSNWEESLDASPLANIPALKDLDLTGNWHFANNVFPASLERLRLLRNSGLKEIPGLNGNRLRFLELFETSVTNLSSLVNHPLEEIIINRTPICDLSFLRETKSLHRLELKETEVRDLSSLKGTALTLLFLEDNPLDNYDVITRLPLQYLVVETNGIPVPIQLTRKNEKHRQIHDVQLPPLILFPDSFDFGEVTEIERPVLTATLRNDGERTVHVTEVIRTCVCANLELSATNLPPGGAAEVRCTLDPNVFSGPFLKTFFIKTDDPATPSITVPIRGSVRQLWEVSPDKWYQLRAGETNAVLRVKAAPDAPRSSAPRYSAPPARRSSCAPPASASSTPSSRPATSRAASTTGP